MIRDLKAPVSFTPGPYRIGEEEDGCVPIHAKTWGALATVVVRVNGEVVGEGLCNASLFKAAPKLVEALRRVACCAGTAANILRSSDPEESARFKADEAFALEALKEAGL